MDQAAAMSDPWDPEVRPMEDSTCLLEDEADPVLRLLAEAVLALDHLFGKAKRSLPNQHPHPRGPGSVVLFAVGSWHAPLDSVGFDATLHSAAMVQ